MGGAISGFPLHWGYDVAGAFWSIRHTRYRPLKCARRRSCDAKVSFWLAVRKSASPGSGDLDRADQSKLCTNATIYVESSHDQHTRRHRICQSDRERRRVLCRCVSQLCPVGRVRCAKTIGPNICLFLVLFDTRGLVRFALLPGSTRLFKITPIRRSTPPEPASRPLE